MEYTIKQVAEKTNLSIYTLRYYDKEGLLPLIKRSESGIRKFTDNDIEWIKLICCLKNSGMSIENIKQFMQCCLQGRERLEDRKIILTAHKKNIEKQIEQLYKSMEIVNYKLEHYKEIGIFHIDEQTE
ncbi:MerR family transcriptional regulator [Lachnotalea glycerini]|uniref:MerR family transcriptional regulator n=1 Tax=Lachnotalea glycerini TaxID=1763509 RepID=A0A371JCX9_9FIRM|nr:MerR family transcriptional regulator [Lachnotalea glycerini]RDY30583.1 MerR family transcriptional regulator [Lachnotalea glycerini]